MSKQSPKSSIGNAFTLPTSSRLLDKETRSENLATAKAKKAVAKDKGKIERARGNGAVE